MHCLKMSNEVIESIEKTMDTWLMELSPGRKSFAEVKIQIEIFQGDALLFVIATQPYTQEMHRRIQTY